MTSAFDLCVETFGKVPASWKDRLLSLEEHYAESELTFAFAEAKRREAKDLKYVEGILKNRRAETGGKVGTDWERETESWKHSPHVHVLTRNDGYSGTAPEVSREEIAGMAIESLRWWSAQPACLLNEKNVALVAEELARYDAARG
jgi:hypothetical protein